MAEPEVEAAWRAEFERSGAKELRDALDGDGVVIVGTPDGTLDANDPVGTGLMLASALDGGEFACGPDDAGAPAPLPPPLPLPP